jgi:hypothetical protein
VEKTTCKRHPNEETRLFCSSCGDPVCPRCAVHAPVGQKCPGCARQARSARARGKPRQYLKAVLAGLAGAAGVSIALFVLAINIQFGVIILSGFGGYGVARAVHWGAERNSATPFQAIAYALALASVQGAALLLGVVFFTGFWLLTYPAALYGAYYLYR